MAAVAPPQAVPADPRQPMEQWNYNQITRSLILGGGITTPEMMESLHATMHVTHVISAAAELDDAALNVPTDKMSFLHILWRDDGTPKPVSDFQEAITWIVRQSQQMNAASQTLPVFYVHCAAGVNRGPMLATAISSILTGVDPQEAWDYIHVRRPQVRAWNNPAYQQSIIDAWQAYHGQRTPPMFLDDVWQVAPGDYDGDGKADFAVWRPSDGTWHVIYSSDGSQHTQQWGQQGDIPVPGDYDGDGKTDFAVWRPSEGNWYVVHSSDQSRHVQQWGLQGDVPVPHDFDKDGKTDFAVWRPSNVTWYVICSSDGSHHVVQQNG